MKSNAQQFRPQAQTLITAVDASAGLATSATASGVTTATGKP
jgi:hypothetical protein